MPHHPVLDKYLKESREYGMSDAEIGQALLRAGWQMHHFVDFFLDHKPELQGNIIFARNLSKFFGDVKALDNVDFDVKRGGVTALLGPNGAGKTTLVRILSTLLSPTSGEVKVAGLDVMKDADKLRALIGLTGQFAAIDEVLTGRENLEMVGKLYHLGSAESKVRAEELLKRFDLLDAADRPAKTYSGGMKRRLDLAESLVAKPRMLFLDEPTTGLDPRSRFELWHIIRDLVLDGTTVLLTTQYLEEADQLADHVYVMDRGKIIANGSPDELKSRIGGDVMELHLEKEEHINKVVEIIEAGSADKARVARDTNTITIPVKAGTTDLLNAVRHLDSAGIKVKDFSLRRPSLDDVFLKLTGHNTEQEQNAK